MRCIVEARNPLGEGALWHTREQALYWVDIQQGLLQRWEFATGNRQSWSLPDRLGAVVERERGGFLAALASELVLFDPVTNEVRPLAAPEAHLRENRTNDGKCDPAGRFWFGTMHDSATQVNGALYRCDPDGRCHCMEERLGIPNGICWSPDARTMYMADSMARTIYAYDFDLANGSISDRRVFAALPKDASGVPDGATVDADGYLWSAVWDGWRVVRYAPDGSVDRVVETPVQRPTSCAFGGPQLDQLFITSAIWDLTAEQLRSQPLAGGVFLHEPGVRGLAAARYKG